MTTPTKEQIKYMQRYLSFLLGKEIAYQVAYNVIQEWEKIRSESMAELKPCRFCHEKDYLTIRSEKLFDMDFYYGYCHICCARGPINCDKEKAVEYWNEGVKDTRETTWSPQ